jgi:hypothetical protein
MLRTQMPQNPERPNSIKTKFGITHLPNSLELNDRFRELGNLEATMRGWSLISANGVEQMLAKIMSGHFFPDDPERQLFLVSLVVSDATFRQKFQMVKNLLRLEYPSLLKKYSPYLKQVDAMVDQRNDMAHALFGPSDDYVKEKRADRIQLRFIRNGKLRTSEVTIDSFNKWLIDAQNLVKALNELETSVRMESIRKLLDHPS